MTLEELQNLLAYHYWARDRLLDAVERLTPAQFRQQIGGSFGSVRDTLSHVIAAECVWCSRWEGEPPDHCLDTESFETVGQLRTRWNETEARVRGFLARLHPEDANRVFDYVHFGGARSNAVLGPSVQHVVNHGSYHRGQVTAMLRQLGAGPPQSQDLIVFYSQLQP